MTPEAIADKAADKTGVAAIRCMNKLFRAHDQSHLYPINGKFDATERAIRKVARMRREGAAIDDGLEYAYAVHTLIGEIVNGSI